MTKDLNVDSSFMGSKYRPPHGRYRSAGGCDTLTSNWTRPDDDPHEVAFYDAELAMELAEHALLLRLGFVWKSLWNEDLAWQAPFGWPGSYAVYGSRQHAINSWRKHVAGEGKYSAVYFGGKPYNKRRNEDRYRKGQYDD